MITEKRTIEHMSTGKALILWMMKMNKKEVEFERINENTINLSTDIIKDEVFEKVKFWRVFLYKYLPMLLISAVFLIHLDFSLDANKFGHINILVSIFTIFTALCMSIIFYDNTQTKNVEKKVLLFIFIFFLAFGFYYFELYIEFMMSMHLAPAFLIVMLIVKDMIEESWKNTYHNKNIGAIFCYKNKKASFVSVATISVVVVVAMLLLVQN
jgi:cyanate permease